MQQSKRHLHRRLIRLIAFFCAVTFGFSTASATETEPTARATRNGPTARPTRTTKPFLLRDLVVDSTRITIPGYTGSCASSDSTNLSLEICIASQGGRSGPFNLTVNGAHFARVNGIAANGVMCVYGPYTYPADTTIFLDDENEIEESNEDNNQTTRFVPIPSRPPVCTPKPTPTPTPLTRPCPGDCNGDGKVTVNELITGINIALDRAEISICPYYADPGCPVLQVCVNSLMDAVNAALHGCP